MKQHRLSEDEQRNVAHFIAQRSLATIGSGETKRAIDKYIEIYNQTLDRLQEYNSNVKD